jgi:hypothetical protein
MWYTKYIIIYYIPIFLNLGFEALTKLKKYDVIIFIDISKN